jgi:hypothetical protein
MKMLPILTQTFEKLRNKNAVYVDKTEHIDNLTKDGGYYFYPDRIDLISQCLLRN